MLFVECTGSPFEIGRQHGTAAQVQIERCIQFYAGLFLKNCKQTWPQVLEHAATFEVQIRAKWPAYHEEMRGIATGARRSLLDIVAINVRTEINFGLFSDGCTALAWHTEQRGWLAQNWDVWALRKSSGDSTQMQLINVLILKIQWMSVQKQNLILTKITQADKPTIIQVTEAGIIGKIGFNSAGLGTLLNAVRVHGVNPSRVPVHLGLRMALESSSMADALQKLKSHGMASSGHILLADTHASTGLEFTSSTFARCVPDAAGRVLHTNHLLHKHPGKTDTVWLKDSPIRLSTMAENAGKLSGEPSWEDIGGLFEDEQHAPGAICRLETPETGSGTLFNIVMDLKSKKAIVRLGRPTRVEETIYLEL